jgi:hypothetical protein
MPTTLKKQIEALILGMKTMSESEAGLTVVAPPMGSYEVLDEGAFLAATNENVDAGIEIKDFSAFVDNQIAREDPDNGKWVALRDLIETHLEQYQEVRVCTGPGASNPKRLYLLGLDDNGYVLGVKSEIVQTS